MKRRLMDMIRCPACGNELRLYVFSERSEPGALPIDAPRCARRCSLHEQVIADERPFKPDCRVCYERDIDEGLLFCAGCRLPFPIQDSVPRLIRNAAEEYPEFFARNRRAVADIIGHDQAALLVGRIDPATFDRRSNESFTLQWERYEYDDRTWFKDDIGLRREEFLYGMDVTADDLRGATVVDAGSGNGRLTASIARFGCEVIGMDLSRSIERANQNRSTIAGDRAPMVHFIQGNVMEPPLAAECCDHVHSSGVLHHTSDPEWAFRRILALVRPRGRIYVQLYREREAWIGVPNRLIRFVTSRMSVRTLYSICHALAPLHAALVLLVARLRGEESPIREASRREQALSLFDNFSPRYQFRYRPRDVRLMFQRAGVAGAKDVTLDNEKRHMVAFVGIKEASHASASPSVDTAA